MESGRGVGLQILSPLLHSNQFSVPYAALAKTFTAIEATTKRLEKTSILTSFLLLVIQRSAPGSFEPLLHAVYLCVNRVSPSLPVKPNPDWLLVVSRLCRHRAGSG